MRFRAERAQAGQAVIRSDADRTVVEEMEYTQVICILVAVIYVSI